MKVLLTGFEAFGGEQNNPSADAVMQLCAQPAPAGIQWQALVLPVEFQRSAQLLRQTLQDYQPDLVLSIGQAGGRTAISLEQVAINLLEARIADNAGWQPSGLAVVPQGPTAYFTTLPVKAIRQALQSEGIPAEISYSAGTYVCNALMYNLMHQLQQQPQCRGGFIHIPYSPAQAAVKPGCASMAISTVVEALQLIVQCCYVHHQDISTTAGALD